MRRVLLLLCLLIKIASPPFHTWLIRYVHLIDTFPYLFFLTIIKVMPFYLLTRFLSFNYFNLLVVLFILTNLTILHIHNIKEMLLIASAISFLWFTFFFLLYMKLFFIYLAVYFVLLWNTFYHKHARKDLVYSLFFLLVIIGLPPFVFFIRKYVLFARGTIILEKFMLLIFLRVFRIITFYRFTFIFLLIKKVLDFKLMFIVPLFYLFLFISVETEVSG